MAAKGQDQKKVPVTVLTGFLGSGKTTLLNHILASDDHKMKFAIIENEFGEVGVDEKIVNASESVDEEVIEVMNGCICCTVRGDLVEALKRLYSKIEKFDGVLIETTGMADPAPVAQTFFVDEEVSSKYRLDGIITVVDAKHVCQHLDEEKPEGAENESEEQLAFADRILLNKIDLVPDAAELDKVEARIKSINSHAQIIRCQQSKVDVAKCVLNLNAFDLDRVLEMDPEFLAEDGGEHVHDNTIGSVSCQFEGELNVFKLNRWIGELVGDPESANNLFRYKGVLAAKGKQEKFVFQGVHMLFAGGFSETQFWKPDEKRECRFVFIGKNLDKETLKQGFMNCKAEEHLRFNIGDTVQARVRAGWREGKVVRQWDDGNCYRIELQNEDKTNIWGPVDDDMCVKAVGA